MSSDPIPFQSVLYKCLVMRRDVIQTPQDTVQRCNWPHAPAKISVHRARCRGCSFNKGESPDSKPHRWVVRPPGNTRCATSDYQATFPHVCVVRDALQSHEILTDTHRRNYLRATRSSVTLQNLSEITLQKHNSFATVFIRYSGRCLFDGPILRPEQTIQVRCV